MIISLLLVQLREVPSLKFIRTPDYEVQEDSIHLSFRRARVKVIDPKVKSDHLELMTHKSASTDTASPPKPAPSLHLPPLY